MENLEWLEKFDENKPKFWWFIEKYFNTELIEKIEKCRQENNRAKLMSILTDIWFKLPSNSFNIIENPPGWNEFLELIDN